MRSVLFRASAVVLILALFSPGVRAEETSQISSDLEKFKQSYSLPEGEVLKRIGPPFPEFRLAYYKHVYKRSPNFALNYQYIRWKNGQFGDWGGSVSSGAPQSVELRTVLTYVTGFHPQYIKGDATDLKTLVNGDFVIRDGATPEQLALRLSEILSKELNLPLKLSMVNSVRRTFVVTGIYKSAPHHGSKVPEVTIGAVEKSFTSGGTGTFDEFLNVLGGLVAHPLMSEIQNPPKQISWRFQVKQPMSETDVSECLKSISDQTGLKFTPKGQKLRVLLVERTR